VVAVRRIRGWSGDAQFTLAAAVALIIGSLTPWLQSPTGFGSDNVFGIELNAGMLSLLVGVVAVWALNRPAGPRAAATSGAIGGLALLAGALVLETLIHHWNDPVAPRWGLWLSGLSALALLAGALLLQGESDEALPPPD
jgi:hypothetical protein